VTDTNVIKLAQPGTFTDSLTEILRKGAHGLLTQAVEMEVADFLGRYADLKTEAGHQRVVRHGHLPEREIMTGIGPVAVRQSRVRDREANGSERIRFSPTILPPYARRTKSLEVLIPILYLKGISNGDFEEALAALLGKDAGGLSRAFPSRKGDRGFRPGAACRLRHSIHGWDRRPRPCRDPVAGTSGEQCRFTRRHGCPADHGDDWPSLCFAQSWRDACLRS
jgi:hypothetical protein